MQGHLLPALEAIPQSSQDQYTAKRQEISFLLNDFLLKYLNTLYVEFNGDFVLAIVLGELAHQNVCQFARQGRMELPRTELPVSVDALRNFLLPCNPFSISESTGIPRETVRRKFEELVRLGLIERISPREYIITSLAAERFMFGLNLRIFEGINILCTHLKTLLDNGSAHVAGNDSD
ncbi:MULTISPECIES: hypothetical protein [Geobacter]|uniref:hypothetical protein n=1 Tax=Geobacter TaxID=28231 RepID=UPI002573D708|nr:hypothetical protein [Geobacter sulfurreducens]BEH10291.1 hypothetical protein GSUET_19030 [Geobacter sulfurreducens subsp. ethanolicus]BET58124.1 hypothetical protein GEO60473_11640 [Geobacter sp. 60473]HML78265.1 hypothetical protein [Geobacter sulfurreducens]